MDASPSPDTAVGPHAELIYAYRFGADGVGHALDAAAALEWLRGAGQGVDGFLWLHFSNPHNIGQPWLDHVDLTPMFKDVLHQERRSSRLAHARHGLFAVINEVDYDLTRRTEPAVSTLWVSVHQRWLLSAWNAPVRAVSDLVARIESGQDFRNPLNLLIPLLAKQAEALQDIVRRAAQIANGIESMLASSHLPRRADLGGIRRDLLRLQHLLAPEPASLFRLLNRMPRWARDEEDGDALHLATENFAVALRDMAGLQDRVRLLEEEIAARVAERTNRGVFVLTSATVIALPVTVIAALFGMNVGGLPWRDSADGFAIVMGLVLAPTALAVALVLRILRD